MSIKYTTFYFLKSVQDVNNILKNLTILYHFVDQHMVKL